MKNRGMLKQIDIVDSAGKKISGTVDNIRNNAEHLFGNWGKSLGGAFG